MSLNWREIARIVSELPLENSLIQRTHQIGFHALVFEMYHCQTGFWELYMEFGTPFSRIHSISGPSRQSRKYKTKKLQRFIQYLRAHIEGSRIIKVQQITHDRILMLHLVNKGEVTYLILRFYSGPGANVIVCDSDMVIQELLYRRPKRGELAGNLLTLPEETPVDDGRFPVRDYPVGTSFNQFIEQSYQQPSTQALDNLIEQVKRTCQEEIAELQNQLQRIERRIEQTSDYEAYRFSGDVLASSVALIEPHQAWVTLPDYRDEGASVTIAIDPSLSAGENIAAYYRKFEKGKAAWNHATSELTRVQNRLEQKEKQCAEILAVLETTGKPDPKLLQSYLQESQTTQSGAKAYTEAPGLHFTSGPFTILVGRNAKENDELLRRWTRGNDWWMHTRDVPGGYVFIKALAGKTIPLETILDAGNLAVLYSKAKEARKADLYYTQVKHLRRPKGGKKGMVLPTQEKNVSIQLDEERIKRLFSTEETGAN
jgi:predicted ribosome quality control (RQC) complex YloA/Tae2 family protein